MRRFCLGLVLAAVLSLSLPGSGQTSERTVRIGMDNYMPYVGADELGPRGIVVDLVKMILSAQEIPYQFEYRPFSRLLREYAHSQLDCMAVGIQADFEFAGQRHAMEPIGRFVAAFVARNGEAEGITSLDQLLHGSWQFGFIKDYAYTKDLLDFISRLPASRKILIASPNPPRALVKMLAARRFDFFIDDELVARYATRELGLTNAVQVFMTHDDPSLDFFVGCHDATLQETINAGIRKAKADGTLDRLIRRYVE